MLAVEVDVHGAGLTIAMADLIFDYAPSILDGVEYVVLDQEIESSQDA
jgi:uncharacterized protein YlxW (UPF0749 family)